MKTILSLSGGIDSASLLGMLLKSGHTVKPVSFQYGSKHGLYELAAAQNLAWYYKLDLQVIDVTWVFHGFNSALLATDSRSIPEGHYEDKSMSQTVVPGRNMIFTSILAGLAQSLNVDTVALGIHAGDHAIYPDCRPEFAGSMDLTIKTATEYKVSLYTPFLNMTKRDIVKIGLKNNVPFEFTRTCYKDQIEACGLCGSCTERLEAFAQNGISDPIEYAK